MGWREVIEREEDDWNGKSVEERERERERERKREVSLQGEERHRWIEGVRNMTVDKFLITW